MSNAHEFSFKTIDGKAMPLSGYKGKAVLVVNTASACGLTPQYKGLEHLWKTYKGKGLVVLGVPSNDFGAQEPGTEGEIKTFCEAQYGVDFPLTSKEHVVGAKAHPLYKWIAEQTGEAGVPKWNFHKYLIGKNGELVSTFGSRTAPEDEEVVRAIEKALK